MGADVCTDFEAAFRPGVRFRDADGQLLLLETVPVGALVLRSKGIGVGDAFTGLAVTEPPSGSLPPGPALVDLAVVTYPNADRRVAAARLRLREEAAARWVEASAGAAVDTGTAAFADGAAAEPWSASDHHEVLEQLMTSTYVPTFSRGVAHAGDLELAVFSSGFGDGMYAAHWGLSAAGDPVALCLDFDLLTEAETEDGELVLPLKRGAVMHPTLAKHGVRASVGWLSAKRLGVNYQPPRYVHARWKLPDGSLQRVQSKHGALNEVSFDMRDAPVGAALVLRVTVGRRRMSEVT